MKANMGREDRMVRVLVAAVIVVLFLTNVISGVLASVLLALAGVFMLTSGVSYCPLYAPFGLTTCAPKET